MEARKLIETAEEEILAKGPIVLWNGMGEFPGRACGLRGLSFGHYRNLYAALQDLVGEERNHIAPERLARAKARGGRAAKQSAGTKYKTQVVLRAKEGT